MMRIFLLHEKYRYIKEVFGKGLNIFMIALKVCMIRVLYVGRTGQSR
jgi:hypothetical protein